MKKRTRSLARILFLLPGLMSAALFAQNSSQPSLDYTYNYIVNNFNGCTGSSFSNISNVIRTPDGNAFHSISNTWNYTYNFSFKGSVLLISADEQDASVINNSESSGGPDEHDYTYKVNYRVDLKEVLPNLCGMTKDIDSNPCLLIRVQNNQKSVTLHISNADVAGRFLNALKHAAYLWGAKDQPADPFANPPAPASATQN